MSIVMDYFRACGIALFIGFVIVFNLANIASVGSNLWLSVWTDSANKIVNSTFHTRLDDLSHRFTPANPALLPFLIFCFIGVAQCVLTLLSDLVFLAMSCHSSNKLHDSMLFSILRSTLHFFESTPSGRIINRFSKDIDAVQRGIPDSLKALLRCVYQVLFTVIVIAGSTPLFLVAFVPIFVIYIFIQVIAFSKIIKSFIFKN
jgi:ABC-type multidrug transport system fused ATPase/permease subunit